MATLPDTIGLGNRPRTTTGVASFSLGRNDAPQILAGTMDEVGRATQIIQQTNIKQDEMAAMDAVNKLKRAAMTLEQDPENGFGSAKGNAVIGEKFVKDYEGRLTNAAEQISAGLSNDYQKKVFKSYQEVVGLQYQSTLLRHQAKETTAFNQLTRENTVSIGMDDIAAHPYDDATYQTNMLQIGRAVVDTGKDLGLTGEALASYTKDKLGDIQSKALQGRLSAMLAQNDSETAQRYFDKHKGEMRLDAVQSVQAALKEARTRNVAQTFGDEIMASGKTMPEALDAARQKFSGADEQAVVQEVKMRFAEREAATLQAQKQASDTAWKVITNGGSRRDIRPDLWDKLSGDEQRQINDYERAKIDRAKADAQGKPTDMAVYYGLRSMAAEDPAAFAKIDLTRSQPHLKDTDLMRLMEIQAGINKGDAKAMETQATVKRTIGMLRSEIAAAGIDMSPKEGSTQAKQTNAFMGAVTQALDEATATKGSPLTADEAKRIGLSMLRDGYEQGSGIFGLFQTKKKGFEMEPGKTYVSKRFSEIPDTARNELVQKQRQISGRGTRPLTADDEAAIERAYQRGLETGRYK